MKDVKDIPLPDQPLHNSVQGKDRRIETQIHRRKKAKALSVLEPEWDQIDRVSSSHLRMPSGCMSPTPFDKAKNK